MVVRVLDVKEALKQTITDVEWDTYVRTLSDTQKKPVRTQARELRRLILGDDSEFWQSCANYCTVMKAVVAVLKEFDGKQPCMGNVYMIMRALRHHVATLHNAPFNMPSDLVEPFEVARMWLAREPGAGSGERGAGIKRAGSRDCRKKSRNR
jgi:hypothetical protein